MPLPGFLGLNWLWSTRQMLFSSRRILVGLKGQFSYPVEDLLLLHGSRHVAGFRHVCLCLGGFMIFRAGRGP